MDPPPAIANPTDLQWLQEENQPLFPWEDQTMELDAYLEMLNDDELGLQDFDIRLWDKWCDEPKLSSDDHGCNVTGSLDDDGLAPLPFLSCNEYVISDHQDNNTSTNTSDDGGQKLGWLELWDDSFPLLISSIVDEDTTSAADLLIKPIDHHEATSDSAVAVDGGRNNWKRGGRRCVAALELEDIEKMFEMPIVMAAKELNVGLTVLKKRCRELNIKRWPHRKLKSIKSLIQNVKEMGLKEEMEMLEENKRMMEKAPEVQLTPRTKKLRQACFKFNYKKRRLLITNPESPHYPNYPFN